MDRPAQEGGLLGGISGIPVTHPPRLGVIVLPGVELHPVPVVLALEPEGGFDQVLGRRLEVVEMTPEGDRRPVDRLATQGGPHTLAAGHALLGVGWPDQASCGLRATLAYPSPLLKAPYR